MKAAPQDLGRRLVEERRRRRGVGRHRLRSRRESGLRRHRQRRAVGAEVPTATQDVDNLYTCSILAVDVDTGELKWHFQIVAERQLGFRQRAAVDAAGPDHQRQARAR